MATLLLCAVALVVGACSGPILANPPGPTPRLPQPTVAPTPPGDPRPIVLPRDDGPHERLTEWWYYTGHLVDASGGRWGFEYVVFRAERGSFPVSWASHLAITDEDGLAFHYAQRSDIGPQADRSPRDPAGTPTGFALAILGADPSNPSTFTRSPWTMAGVGGRDVLDADAGVDETGSVPIGLTLSLAAERPVALHDEDGWIPFGPAGGSYYYSRTRMAAEGELRVGDATLAVTGIAWFDHQWGDFIAVGAGGWDWFAINLDDGTDLTISSVRDADGRPVLVYGTLVGADGGVRHVPPGSVAIEALDTWRSERTGITYPAGWQVTVPDAGLRLELEPTVADQELDTRPTTGVIYWEGSQRVTGTRDGSPIAGRGYVELTGYGG